MIIATGAQVRYKQSDGTLSCLVLPTLHYQATLFSFTPADTPTSRDQCTTIPVLYTTISVSCRVMFSSQPYSCGTRARQITIGRSNRQFHTLLHATLSAKLCTFNDLRSIQESSAIILLCHHDHSLKRRAIGSLHKLITTKPVNPNDRHINSDSVILAPATLSNGAQRLTANKPVGSSVFSSPPQK